MLFGAWIGFWAWAFSCAFSDSFFAYNLHARLPTFLAALLCVSVIPVSAVVAWRQVTQAKRRPVTALAIHLLTTIAALAVPLAVTYALARAPRPWRLEADDAMGVGIDNAALLLVATASVVVLTIVLAVRHARKQIVRPSEANSRLQRSARTR
ncbi:MAG: hypothetical protein WAM94_20515 [Chromatiaceae bacterium]